MISNPRQKTKISGRCPHQKICAEACNSKPIVHFGSKCHLIRKHI